MRADNVNFTCIMSFSFKIPPFFLKYYYFLTEVSLESVNLFD